MTSLMMAVLMGAREEIEWKKISQKDIRFEREVVDVVCRR